MTEENREKGNDLKEMIDRHANRLTMTEKIILFFEEASDYDLLKIAG